MGKITEKGPRNSENFIMKRKKGPGKITAKDPIFQEILMGLQNNSNNFT